MNLLFKNGCFLCGEKYCLGFDKIESCRLRGVFYQKGCGFTLYYFNNEEFCIRIYKRCQIFFGLRNNKEIFEKYFASYEYDSFNYSSYNDPRPVYFYIDSFDEIKNKFDNLMLLE